MANPLWVVEGSPLEHLPLGTGAEVVVTLLLLLGEGGEVLVIWLVAVVVIPNVLLLEGGCRVVEGEEETLLLVPTRY